MKRRILDVSDCAESPMLAESRLRHKWGRRSWTDNYLVPQANLRSRGNPKIDGLTEEYFTGIHANPQLAPLDSNSSEVSTDEALDESYENYRAKCARRWWAEFRRWFGVPGQDC